MWVFNKYLTELHKKPYLDSFTDLIPFPEVISILNFHLFYFMCKKNFIYQEYKIHKCD